MPYKKLSVVIPVYNEEENLEKCVKDVFNHFPDAELILVNDHSTDKTFEIIGKLMRKYENNPIVHIYHPENKGHGRSVVDGLNQAKGDYVLYIDADRQIDLREAELWIGARHWDIISGWRVGRHDKLFRKFISFGLRMTNLFRHWMFIKDANCPFKIYKRDTLKFLLYKLDEAYYGKQYETHIVPIAVLEVLARREGFHILTVPTPHRVYEGVRQGFLQSLNKKSIAFILKAFREVATL